MKHFDLLIIALVAAALAAGTALAAQKSRSALGTEFDSNIAFNSTGDITAQGVNDALTNSADSAFNLTDDDWGDVEIAGSTKTADYEFTAADVNAFTVFSSSGSIAAVVPAGHDANDLFIAVADPEAAGIPFVSAGSGLTLYPDSTVSFTSAGEMAFIRYISSTAAHVAFLRVP